MKQRLDLKTFGYNGTFTEKPSTARDGYEYRVARTTGEINDTRDAANRALYLEQLKACIHRCDETPVTL